MMKFKSMESQITMTRRLLVDLEAAQVLHAYISLSLSLSLGVWAIRSPRSMSVAEF